MKRILAICIFGTAALSGAAVDSGMSTYRFMAVQSLAMCRSAIGVAQYRMGQGDSATEALNNGNGTDGDGNWPKCVAERSEAVLAQFQIAVKGVRKPALREALKSYQVIFASSLQGVVPGAGERKIDYAQRQQMADTRLSEAWTRVEIEQLP